MGDSYKSLTYSLFARPSFIGGMARSFDMGATLQQYNRSETGEAADTKALSGDWKSVGQDMSDALDNYGQKPA